MKLHFVLDDEGFSLVVDLLGELGRNCMMGCSILDNKTLIAFHALEDMGFFDSPFTNISPLLILVGAFGVLLGVGGLPSCLPVVCKLLEEVGLDGSWL